MFFKELPEELNRAIKNLHAQRELLERQLNEGSISKEAWQKEQKRLSSLINAYNDNIITIANEQKTNHSFG